MGIEIRRVPPNYEHPIKSGNYIPKHEENFHDEMQTWMKHYLVFLKYPKDYFKLFLENNPLPDPEYYSFYNKDALENWFQVYETVSKGTPVTPPFKTKGELVDYLVYLDEGYAPTMIVDNQPGEMNVKMGSESFFKLALETLLFRTKEREERKVKGTHKL